MLPAAYVYILTNKHHTVLYVGMTTDLRTRLWEHQKKVNPSGFTARYNVFKPIYYKGFDSEEEALERERFVKGKSRKWKEELIAEMNPDWNDLTEVIVNMHPLLGSFAQPPPQHPILSDISGQQLKERSNDKKSTVIK